MANGILLVLSTFPDAESARSIARQLVAERAAACANILPQIESIYWWQEKVESGGEALVFFKTTSERYSAVEARLRELHPYEVPEIIAFSMADGLPAYLQWVTSSCSQISTTV